MRGDRSPRAKTRESSTRRVEDASLMEFGRDWKGRYCEKTMKKKYGLSDRQFQAAKRELKKKVPYFATKATQSPSNFAMPQVTE